MLRKCMLRRLGLISSPGKNASSPGSWWHLLRILQRRMQHTAKASTRAYLQLGRKVCNTVGAMSPAKMRQERMEAAAAAPAVGGDHCGCCPVTPGARPARKRINGHPKQCWTQRTALLHCSQCGHSYSIQFAYHFTKTGRQQAFYPMLNRCTPAPRAAGEERDQTQPLRPQCNKYECFLKFLLLQSRLL